MAKKHSHRRRSSSKSRTMRLKGGNLSGNPPSAWGWGLGTLGNGWTQFMNSLSVQPGASAGAMQSNVSVPAGSVHSQSQSGGKRRRARGKRGGNMGLALSQAVVPGTLVLMNNMLGKRSRRQKR